MTAVGESIAHELGKAHRSGTGTTAKTQAEKRVGGDGQAPRRGTHAGLRFQSTPRGPGEIGAEEVRNGKRTYPVSLGDRREIALERAEGVRDRWQVRARAVAMARHLGMLDKVHGEYRDQQAVTAAPGPERRLGGQPGTGMAARHSPQAGFGKRLRRGRF